MIYHYYIHIILLLCQTSDAFAKFIKYNVDVNIICVAIKFQAANEPQAFVKIKLFFFSSHGNGKA